VLVYVGGAAGLTKYQARLGTEPSAIRQVIEVALAAVRLPRLDVLICPGPEDSRLPGEATPVGLPWFEDHWDRELAQALGQAPTAVGLVGHSAGAAFAIHMGVVLEAPAVATLGGAGAMQALRDPELARLVASLDADGWRGCDVALYRNSGDESDDPAVVAKALRGPLRPHPMAAGRGGHKFEYYASNGAAAAAFRFVMERLGRS